MKSKMNHHISIGRDINHREEEEEVVVDKNEDEDTVKIFRNSETSVSSGTRRVLKPSSSCVSVFSVIRETFKSTPHIKRCKEVFDDD